MRTLPLLGYLTRFAGTVFINRGSARDSSALLSKIEEPLREGCLVVCFPEGGSTDGTDVRAFHPLLFEAAVRAGAPVIPAALGYSSVVMAERELAFYGEDRLMANLLRTTRQKRIDVWVEFGQMLTEVSDRKTAAAAAHNWVTEARKGRRS